MKGYIRLSEVEAVSTHAGKPGGSRTRVSNPQISVGLTVQLPSPCLCSNVPSLEGAPTEKGLPIG